MLKNGSKLYTIIDEYSILSQIGQGGNGTVFKANNVNQELLAIKVINSNQARDKVRRFRNEIEFCMQNEHPNIIHIIDSGRNKNENLDCCFYVMPLYDETLKEKMQKGISPENAVEIFINILCGLQYAHDKGTVHRDIKPENVLFNRSNNNAVIADFGIAHIAPEYLAADIKTTADDRLLNIKYSAPEQKTKGQAVDGRADVFACGLLLNEMITGQLAIGERYQLIASKYPDYDYLDELVSVLICQNPLDRLFPIQEILMRLDILSANKKKSKELSELIKNKIDDTNPYVDIPEPKIIDLSISGNLLRLKLSYEVPDAWVYYLNRGCHSGRSLVEYPSENFRKRREYIEIDLKRNHIGEKRIHSEIVRFFKEWIPFVTRAYNETKKREHIKDIEQKKVAHEEEVRKAREELEANSFLKTII